MIKGPNPVNITQSYSNLPTSSKILGGPYNGYSPQQTLVNYKDSEGAMTRKIIRSGWNAEYASGTVNGHKRVITPFRAVNNSGDFLARQNYACGGPNPSHLKLGGIVTRFGSLINHCDGTGVPASACNGRFVADSSDFTLYKKQSAISNNYNDLSNGGDQNNASFVSLMAVRRR